MYSVVFKHSSLQHQFTLPSFSPLCNLLSLFISTCPHSPRPSISKAHTAPIDRLISHNPAVCGFFFKLSPASIILNEAATLILWPNMAHYLPPYQTELPWAYSYLPSRGRLICKIRLGANEMWHILVKECQKRALNQRRRALCNCMGLHGHEVGPFHPNEDTVHAVQLLSLLACCSLTWNTLPPALQLLPALSLTFSRCTPCVKNKLMTNL